VADSREDVATDAAPSCEGPFSIMSQQPTSCLPYPNALWSKPLPSNVMQHLLAGSDAIAQNTFSDAGQFSYPWPRAQGLGTVSSMTSDGFDSDSPLYYGESTDPLYVVASCAYNSAAPHDATGKTFHIPSAATFSFEGGGDSFFAVWDQTSDLLLAAYGSPSTWLKLPACPGGGHAGTMSDPCPLTFEYCGVSTWSNDTGLDIESGDSLGNGGWALHNRAAEMMSGVIAHAQYLETDCTVGNVFPAISNTFQCANPTNKPPEGALFFLDYTPAQLADIKTAVPLWQYELLESLTIFGGYMGDTHGSAEGIALTRYEGPAAYNLAGIPYPLTTWFQMFPYDDAAADAPLLCFPRTAGVECEMNPFVSVPLETGPNCTSTSCDVSKHLHVADPCIAKTLAGVAGGC
jgi:hypothetical protein